MGDLVKTTLGPKGMDKILQSAYVENFFKDEARSERHANGYQIDGRNSSDE